MTTSTFSSSSVSVAIAYISGGFFLSCGKSRPRRLGESLWLASENIFNSIFCQLLVPLSLSLSLSLPAISIFLTYDEYAYVLTARCSYAPRCALCCLWPSFSVVQSAPKSNEYFEKRKKLHRSLDEIYFPLLHILWVIFGWSGLCTYAFHFILTTTHEVP